MHMEETGLLDAPPAEECPVCGCVSEAGEPAACDCGTAYVETVGPKLLAGKYRLMRRLGRGGMGAALARDLRLERDVAVKTLSGESHRAVAQIHGIESWRGRRLAPRRGSPRPAGSAPSTSSVVSGWNPCPPFDFERSPSDRYPGAETPVRHNR